MPDSFPSRSHPASEVRDAIEKYLKGTSAAYPKSLAALVETGKFHPLHEVGLKTTAVET